MALDARQPIRAKLDADIADLAWVGLFVGDAMEVGGTVKANLEAQGTLAGKWTGSGAPRRPAAWCASTTACAWSKAGGAPGRRHLVDSLRFPACCA